MRETSAGVKMRRRRRKTLKFGVPRALCLGAFRANSYYYMIRILIYFSLLEPFSTSTVNGALNMLMVGMLLDFSHGSATDNNKSKINTVISHGFIAASSDFQHGLWRLKLVQGHLDTSISLQFLWCQRFWHSFSPHCSRKHKMDRSNDLALKQFRPYQFPRLI